MIYFNTYYHKVSDKNYNFVKEYKNKYKLSKGDMVMMEVDLRYKEKMKRCLYFYVKDRWDRAYFHGLPESVKFGV